ncbi:Monooxygenase, FAD-binding [Penicillium expansum]|uniref:Monooxygenase, FAD-binding n=1 Tax=Penicillium expansum TaxID=27334 RepID=A0A0A2IIR3_PENEN|nr:Monooxygenase, FAD-binding [Penicillium expansum]KGO42336.1 Monooxygenase, FAD-binding [Penicillium expansum]KGO56378.1 Monooxygenase, FAD-binding [Penicillium expansum]KGO63234.1 Monooxygenase, FAD-binding [Penicillium expansum]
MKIAIIGAGIAGCAAYLELQKHLPQPSKSDESHEVIIYEAYNTSPSITANERKEDHTHSSTLIVGGGLGVAPNGLNVLKRLDKELLKDVVRGGASLDDNTNNNNNRPPHMLATSRHSLWTALRGRIPDHHIIHKRVTQVIARSDGRNSIRFADNSPIVEADLVIGADGVRGIAKRALFPDAKEDPYPPHYEGLVGVGGFIPAADVKDLVEPGSMNFVFGGNGFFGYFFSESSVSAGKRDSPYHVSEPGDSLAWWSTYEIEECPDRKTLDMVDVTRQLRERHAYWKEPVVKKVIQSLQVENMYPTWTLPALPTWERDGVVLVGDAAHALPSSSGQGSSQALEDVEALALFLAHYLHALPDEVTPKAQKNAIKAAASQYVSLRQPHVNAILESAQKTQNSKREMGILKEYSMYAMMKIMGLFPGFLANQIRAAAEYNIADDVARIIASDD